MSIQIGRFSFRGPFTNLDEIKDRPGIFIVHKGEQKIDPYFICETPLLKSSIEKELKANKLELGSQKNCFISVYNTFCVLTLDRKEMVEEIETLLL
ncbi:hypothetical protein L3049_12565 [Labilibaculum sp. DW002]|uniref:Uncharacterized protein n=1 Tax=Paralabilibaculum antarcticum TaxID=2912572 RepID=A0ABT5VTU8_9BACT|nr:MULTISPECIES: hypothetical protein [unclassified Labilibaculum]MBI9057889.1 hypothetical protein [Labilibaculum sp.]MDE5418840.1 hypothetical protein [Labilibaculum sp. DW002]